VFFLFAITVPLYSIDAALENIAADLINCAYTSTSS
jgi:hypothetical protein